MIAKGFSVGVPANKAQKAVKKCGRDGRAGAGTLDAVNYFLNSVKTLLINVWSLTKSATVILTYLESISRLEQIKSFY